MARKRPTGSARAARLARRQADSSRVGPAYITRAIPCYELLNEEGLQQLEDHAEWILQEIGIEFRGDTVALQLFKEAGASVDQERVRFDKGHARSLCQSAPKVFTMHARDPDRSVLFGDNHVVFSPAYGSPFVTDLQGGRRYGTLKDFENFIKLTEVSPWLHHSGGTVCEPVDVPVNKRHLDMVFAHIKYSRKPFMGAVTDPQRAQDSVDMARIVFGAEFVERNCVVQGNINVNSPLVYDSVMSGSLRAYAAANQGLLISPFILGGAMSPVTQAALISQAHAEALAGIALSQLVRPGSPMIYGSFLTTMDLKTGAPTFGTPEATLATLAIGQLCRRLGLPFRCGGHLTASKTADAQAMQESADTMTPGLLAGANFIIQSAGWLEGGLTIGYEKFVMDADRCGMMHRMLQGLALDQNQFAVDAYREAGPGLNFLGVAHTLANFETANHRAELTDTKSFEQWTDDGGLDTQQRAHVYWQELLASYEAPDLDSAIEDELNAFITNKKASMPDMWY